MPDYATAMGIIGDALQQGDPSTTPATIAQPDVAAARNRQDDFDMRMDILRQGAAGKLPVPGASTPDAANDPGAPDPGDSRPPLTVYKDPNAAPQGPGSPTSGGGGRGQGQAGDAPAMPMFPMEDASAYGVGTSAAGASGILSNDRNGDGALSGLAKGTATALIRGIPQRVLGMGSLRSPLGVVEDWTESKITGKPYEQVAARHQADYDAVNQDIANRVGPVSKALPAVGPKGDLNGSVISDPILKATGAYQPTTWEGRMAMAGTEAAASAGGPGMGAVRAPLSEGAAGAAAAALKGATPAMAVSGAAGQGITDATDSPMAGVVAGFAVPMGLGAAAEAARAGGGAVARAVPPITSSGRDAYARRTVAGEMQRSASDPAAAAANLQTGDREIVPGSKGTTAEVSGDLGLGRWQAGMADAPAMKARAGEQEAARQAALGEVQTGGSATDLPASLREAKAAADAETRGNVSTVDARTGASAQLADTVTQGRVAAAEKARQSALDDLRGLKPDASPADFTDHLRSVMSAMDAEHDAHVTAAEAQAARDPIAVRGAQSSGEVGAAARAPVSDALRTDKARENALWDAFDPHKDLLLPAAPITDGARRIAGEVSSSAKPMTGEEQRLFNEAASYGPLTPFRHVTDLRSAVSDAIRAANRDPALAQSGRRLTMLRGVIQDAIEHGFENQAALEGVSVRRGTMAAEDGIVGRVRQWRDGFGAQSEARTATVRGADRGDASGGSVTVPGVSRTEGQGDVRPGNSASDPGVSSRAEPALGGTGRNHVFPGDVPLGREKAPQSLVAFLRQAGGIREFDGELAARDLHRQFPGLVNNRTGMPLDRAREIAAEAGYLGADTAHAVGNTDVNDFLHAMDNHPVYSVHDEGRLADRQSRAEFREYQAKVKDAANDIRGQMTTAGRDPRSVNRDILHAAAGHMVDRGATWEEALERANDAHVADLQDAAHEEQHRAQGERGYVPPRSDEGEGRGAPRAVAFERGDLGNVGEGRGGPREGDPADEGRLLDEGAAGRLKAATDATRERVARFGTGAAGQILRKGETAGSFKIPDAKVPDAIWRKGGAGADAVRSYLGAGGSPEALFDAAAMSARTKAMQTDGSLHPGRVSEWLADHREALQAMPSDVADRFTTSLDTHRSVEDAMVARKDAQTTFQRSEAGKAAKLEQPSDIVDHVGRIIDGTNAPVQRMRELAASVKGNPEAEAGFKRAVVEHVLDKFVPEVGDPKAAKLDEYLSKKGDVLAEALPADDLRKLHEQSAQYQARAADAKRSITSREGIMRDVNLARTNQMKAAEADRAQKMSEFQRGVVGQLIGTNSRGDVLNLLKGVVNSKDGAARMTALAEKAGKVEGGTDALRRGLLEMVQRDVNTPDAVDPRTLFAPREAFDKFMTGKRDVLQAAGFSPAQINALNNVAKDGIQANRSISNAARRGQSPAELSEAAGHTSLLSRIAHDVAGHAAAAGGGLLGYGLGGLHGGALGSFAGWIGKSTIGALRDAGLNRVREMRVEAALNPDFGLALLQAAPKNRNAIAMLGQRARQLSILGAERRQDDQGGKAARAR